jgi:hypothetical protein
MKNIHLLPTNLSRLYYTISMSGYNLKLSERPISKSSEVRPQHIYITNDEEIKEGDYILIHGHYKHGKHITKVVKITDTYEVIEGGNHSKKACQRIILTTDGDLIKDGVQVIDDKFLEWFVNNPSCEFVKVNKEWNEERIINGKDIGDYSYKIIIPKEEPKQERMYSEEDMKKAIKFGLDGLYGYQMGEDGYFDNQVKRFLKEIK